MPGAEATGWTVSSIAPVQRYGVRSEDKNHRYAGLGPGDLRVDLPKASAREFHQKQLFVLYRKALRAQRAGQPGCHRALGGLAPTASGASSVASALGIRSGATPSGHHQLNPTPPQPASKPDISTWQRSGHFYLALTARPAGGRRTDRMSARHWPIRYLWRAMAGLERGSDAAERAAAPA